MWLPTPAPKFTDKTKALEYLQLLDAKEKLLCERSFYTFFKHAWNVIEPATPLVTNWHMKVLCDEFQAQAERIQRREPKQYDLLISVPPRSLKSTIISKALNPWIWCVDPSQKFLTASYSSYLALEHAVQSRRIIQSEWYQNLWGNVFEMTTDQNVKQFFENDKTGYRMATSVGGSGTGRGGNWVVVDDPISVQDADSETVRKAANDWWTQTMYTRVNNALIDIRVVIQHRVHASDLTGHILTYQADKYKHYCLPAEDCEAVRPVELRQKYVNGYLFPARLTPAFLAEAKTTMLDYAYAGQYQQQPSPSEGGIFKKHWWKFWQLPSQTLPAVVMKVAGEPVSCDVVTLPTSPDEVLCSWDMAFKDLASSDYVVGQVWASQGPNKYLLEQVREKLDYPATEEAVKKLSARFKRASCILIEDKANGPAVIASMKRTEKSVIPVTPQGSKFARAVPMASQAKAGNLFLPHPANAPWVTEFIDNFAKFPKGDYDDEIDAASQAIDHLSGMKRVWQSYGREAQNFRIDFSSLDVDTAILVSQWVADDLQTALIMATWNRRRHQLVVFDELVASSAAPEAIIKVMATKIRAASDGVLTTVAGNKVEWLGNDKMFSDSGDTDMKEVYGRYRLWPSPNPKYDEPGAIIAVNRLLGRSTAGIKPENRSLIIHERCKELTRQMAAWCFENNKPDAGHLMCRALCNLVSTLTETGRMVKTDRTGEKAYSVKGQAMRDRMRRMAAAGDFVGLAMAENHGSIPAHGPKGWMV
jgi:predicted phage terminase large subunit-like protein